MAEVKDKITQLEDKAKNLVKNLEELHDAVGKYREAKVELEKTNENLSDLVNQTKQLTIESHDIIRAINNISTSEILKKIDMAVKTQHDEINKQKEYTNLRIEKFKKLMLLTNGVVLLILLIILILLVN